MTDPVKASANVEFWQEQSVSTSSSVMCVCPYCVLPSCMCKALGMRMWFAPFMMYQCRHCALQGDLASTGDLHIYHNGASTVDMMAKIIIYTNVLVANSQEGVKDNK